MRLDRLLVHRHALLSLGDPVPLVTTHRRNPDRFIYLGVGGGPVEGRTTPRGASRPWTARSLTGLPPLSCMHGWAGQYRPAIARWLHQNGYVPRYVGKLADLVTPGALERASQQGVELTTASRESRPGAGGAAASGADCG